MLLISFVIYFLLVWFPPVGKTLRFTGKVVLVNELIGFHQLEDRLFSDDSFDDVEFVDLRF